MAAAAAEAAAQPSLDVVVVEARRPTPSSTAFDPRLIEARDPFSLADLLGPAPGVTLSVNSRGETVLSVRGRTEREASVFLGGVPLADPWDGRADLSRVPAAAITGGALRADGDLRLASGSALLLEAGVGGDAVQVSAGTQDFGRVALAGERRGVSLAIDAQTLGDQPLPENASLPFSQTGEDRTNTDRQQAAGFAANRYQLGPAAAESFLLVSSSSYGVAPESHLDPSTDDVRFWRVPQDRRATLGTAVSLGSWRSDVWLRRLHKDIRSYSDATYDRLVSTQNGESGEEGLRLSWSAGEESASLTIGSGAARLHHRERDGGAPTEKFARARYGAFAHGTIRPTSATEIVGGLRFEGIDTLRSGGRAEAPDLSILTGRLGMTRALGPAASLTLGAARIGRLPSQRELYGSALGRFIVNPDLRPEKRWSFSAALDGEIGPWSLSLRPFGEIGTSTIIQETVLDDLARRRIRLNGPGDRAYGFDAEARAELGRDWAVIGGLTVMNLVSKSNTPLFERPEEKLTVQLIRDPDSGLGGYVGVVGRGEAFSQGPEGEPVRLPSSLRFDAEGFWRLPREEGSVDIYLRADNLTDELILPQLGLPAPGRRLEAGIRLSR
jgi:iron complex outermembrane receptor protein